MKLRLSYGQTGQQDISTDYYPYLARYQASLPTAQYQFGNEFISTLRPNGYDANIKWEETDTYNAGLDYEMANGRLYGALDVYYRKTTDLINFIPVPAGTNLTNFINTNVGDLENRGFELSDDVGNYLLRHYQRNLADLFVLLERLDRVSLAEQRRLTVPFVKSVIAESVD